MIDFDDFDDTVDDDGTLNGATVDAIRRGNSSVPDVEAAERLLEQVAALMVAVSTGGPRIDDVKTDYAREYKALSAVLRRLGIANPNPHAELWTWYGKWSGDADLSTWASRRSYIAEMYEQTRKDLDTYADSAYEVATGTDDGPTGWADVDAKMGALRRRLREAEDADDFKAVGLQCVSVLEALGRAVFNPERHLPEGEEVPHPNDAQTRLGFFLKSVTKGKRFEEVRPIIRSSWRQAQAVKHRNDPNRTDAGIAADAIALLTAITRRLADEESESALPKSDAIPF